MFGKNDVYVVFRVGTKKVKTHHIKNAGKHASFQEILTMNLSDSDLEHGIDVGAYDYDVEFVGRFVRTGQARELVGPQAHAERAAPVQGAVQI